MRLIFKNIRNRKKLILLGLDIFSVSTSSFFSYFLVLSNKDVSVSHWIGDIRFFNFLIPVIIIYCLVLYVFGLYEVESFFRKIYTLSLLLVATITSLIVFLLLSRLFNLRIYSKYILLVFGPLIIIFLLMNRIVFIKLLILPKKRRRGVLLVGSDSLTPLIINEMKASDYNIVGIFYLKNSKNNEYLNNIKVISNNKKLEDVIRDSNVKVIILGLGIHFPSKLVKEIYRTKLHNIEIFRSDDFYEILTRKVPLTHYLEEGSVPFPNTGIFVTPLFRNTKRVLDVIGSAVLLILLSPVILLISVVIICFDGVPVFYVQERLGAGQRPFKLIKFRTMVKNAESQNGPQWASKNDERVTKLGRFLRRMRLDELPQLVNILKGEMSFVGPRPIRRYFADLIEEKVPFYPLRFSVKPGLTGWAQVHYDYGNTLEGQIEKFQYDLYYIKHASLFMDLFIILKTIQTFIRRPAY